MGTKCPECRSDDVIEWDDGFLCRDCGCEFDDPERTGKHKNDDEEDEDE